jgi:phenylacetate-CoA ligase
MNSIETVQLAALRRLLAEVAVSNPFYAPILQHARLDGELPSLEAFTERMPLTDKQTIVDDQRRHPPYGTNLTYPLEAYSRFNQTSATSGRPLRWLDTPASWQWMLDNWKQVYTAAGVEPADRLYFAFSFGPFLGFWTAFEAATQIGCLCLPGGGLSSLGRLAAIRDNRANVVLCTPTYALRLAEVAVREGFDLAALGVRRIIVAGEPGGSRAAVRQAVESQWGGATVFDHHGMTEVGPVSYQSPEGPGTLLVIARAYLAEVIDPQTTEPAPPGEVGELVLTPLGRIGAPLLRYRTGDLVREDRSAGHGGTYDGQMALQGGILGRTDDMVVIRGVNLFPAAVDDVMRDFEDVAEYRVEIRQGPALAELRLEVEPVAECQDATALTKRIEARVRSAFSLRVPVTICPPGTLPRFEMKAHRWLRT